MLRSIAFVLLSSLSFTAGAHAQNAAPEKPVVKLGIGSKIQIPYLAVNIAEHKGYFKEQGLTVEFNDFGGGGSDSLKALVSGSVDFIAGDSRIAEHGVKVLIAAHLGEMHTFAID